MTEIVEVDLGDIVVKEDVRKILDEGSIEELSSSIQRHGVIQPITVQPTPDGRYELLIGSRRVMAAKHAGLERVPAIVLEKALKGEEALEAKLVENLHREGLDPLDEAEAYQQLRDMGHNVSEVARRVGKPRYYVSKRLRLLRLHPELREGVRHRTLKPGHAHALLRLEPKQQLALATQIQSEGLSVKETRHRVREILGKELKWRLVPVRFSLEVYETLRRIAPEGDVKRLILETVEKLVQT